VVNNIRNYTKEVSLLAGSPLFTYTILYIRSIFIENWNADYADSFRNADFRR
jgi:hypothetical protein